MKTTNTILQQDADLVVACQQKMENAAFGVLYSKYFHPVFLYCKDKLQDREEALDLTQDIFVKVANKINTLQQPKTFAAWLFQIARNACFDQLNLRKKRMLELSDSHLNISDYEELEHSELFRDRLDLLEVFISQLDDDAKNVVFLKYMEKKSIREIALLLSLSESAVKMRLSRARSKLINMFH